MKPIHANQLLAGLALAEPDTITDVVTDSRKVVPGCVFVCFPGEHVDGHDYAAAAYRAGASYIIANHPVEGVPEDRTVIVASSHHAMVRMASNYRMLFGPLMIGVTGSVGKNDGPRNSATRCCRLSATPSRPRATRTTRSACPTRCSAWTTPPSTLVVEMGMSNLGEIRPPDPCGAAVGGHHHPHRRITPGKSRHPGEYTESKARNLLRPARRRAAGAQRRR